MSSKMCQNRIVIKCSCIVACNSAQLFLDSGSQRNQAVSFASPFSRPTAPELSKNMPVREIDDPAGAKGLNMGTPTLGHMDLKSNIFCMWF